MSTTYTFTHREVESGSCIGSLVHQFNYHFNYTPWDRVSTSFILCESETCSCRRSWMAVLCEFCSLWRPWMAAPCESCPLWRSSMAALCESCMSWSSSTFSSRELSLSTTPVGKVGRKGVDSHHWDCPSTLTHICMHMCTHMHTCTHARTHMYCTYIHPTSTHSYILGLGW